jgi:predicted N-acetyltransferase YhbS
MRRSGLSSVLEKVTLIPDDGLHDSKVEALYARAFGPGRFAKAAARLREGNNCQRDLSFLALTDGVIVGACRLWPITDATGSKSLFLGPVAVDQSMRSIGLGRRLVEACLAQINKSGPSVTILVGDHAYFGPMGFDIVPCGQVTMPGSVDPKRLLWRVHGVGATNLPVGLLRV